MYKEALCGLDYKYIKCFVSVNNLFPHRIGDLSKTEKLENEDLRNQNWKMILSIIIIYKQSTLKFENEASQILELEN